MTKQQHPIAPPPELVQQWLGDFFGCTPDPELSDSERFLATRAAQWGADQELEACCEWVEAKHWIEPEFVVHLRAARRPKPPSLKQQALTILEDTDLPAARYDILLRALEALPND
jgi:hypothetical protein